MFFFLLLTVLFAAAVVTFWSTIRDTVAAWLRRKTLGRHSLMRAWVHVTRVVQGIRRFLRRTVFVQTRPGYVARVSEKEFNSAAEIDDPEVREAIRRHATITMELTN